MLSNLRPHPQFLIYFLNIYVSYISAVSYICVRSPLKDLSYKKCYLALVSLLFIIFNIPHGNIVLKEK